MIQWDRIRYDVDCCVLFICISLVTVYSPKKIEQNKVSLKAFVRLNLNYFIHVKQCDTEAGRLDDQDRRVSANPPYRCLIRSDMLLRSITGPLCPPDMLYGGSLPGRGTS